MFTFLSGITTKKPFDVEEYLEYAHRRLNPFIFEEEEGEE